MNSYEVENSAPPNMPNPGGGPGDGGPAQSEAKTLKDQILQPLKRIWLWSSVLAVVIPLAEVIIHKNQLDREWASAVSEIMLWLWPTQIFGLVLYSPSAVNNPASHWPAIVLTLSVTGNILLYNIVGTIGYLVFRMVLLFRHRAKSEARR